MASIYDIKPWFQAGLRPVVRGLARLGVTANLVTLLAVGLSAAGGAVVAFGHAQRWPLLLVPVVLLVRMALNAIDGMLAREYDQRTRLGAMLNEIGDVVSDAAIYLPLALVPGISAPLVVAMVVLAIISEMTGVVATQVGADRRYDGPMGKSDRAAVVGAAALALGVGAPADPWMDWVLLLMVLLLAATIVNRGRQALAQGR